MKWAWEDNNKIETPKESKLDKPIVNKMGDPKVVIEQFDGEGVLSRDTECFTLSKNIVEKDILETNISREILKDNSVGYKDLNSLFVDYSDNSCFNRGENNEKDAQKNITAQRQFSEVILSNGETLDDKIARRKRNRNNFSKAKDIAFSVAQPSENTSSISNRKSDYNLFDKVSQDTEEQNNFIQSNLKNNSIELQLVKSMGLTREVLSKVAYNSNLNFDNEKVKDVIKKSIKDFNITPREKAILDYLAIVGFASKRNIELATRIRKNKISLILRNLVSKKYIVQAGSLSRVNAVYHITQSGANELNARFNTQKYRGFVGKKAENKAEEYFKERGYVNHFLAIIYSGRYNILQDENWEIEGYDERNRPIWKKHDSTDGRKGSGFKRGAQVNIITESVIVSAREKIVQDKILKMYPDLNGVAVSDIARFLKSTGARKNDIFASDVGSTWRSYRQNINTVPPEKSSPGYYVIVNKSGDYMFPDFVIEKDRAPDGSPRSIAIEVERKEYDKKLYSKLYNYAVFNNVYGQIVYIVDSKKNMERVYRELVRVNHSLENSGRKERLVLGGNFKIVPSLDWNGNIVKKGKPLNVKEL